MIAFTLLLMDGEALSTTGVAIMTATFFLSVGVLRQVIHYSLQDLKRFDSYFIGLMIWWHCRALKECPNINFLNLYIYMKDAKRMAQIIQKWHNKIT